MEQSNNDSKKLSSLSNPKYVLFILFFIYVFNFADRFILMILQNDIQKELMLTDQQLGLLSGIAFAIFYAILGLPFARLADRYNRTTIITIGLTAWSALTAACGLVQNFIQFALVRVGVGIGEATATPCSHSIISDYYPAAKRAKAIGLYSIGANIGMLVGMIGGAAIAQKFGWRVAFFSMGLPGILLAILVKVTIKEPPRGFSDNIVGRIVNLPVVDTVKYLFRLKSFRHLCAAFSIAAFTGYGIMNWAPVYFLRSFGMTKTQSGPILGIAIGIVGGLSTFLGGFLSDKMSTKKSRKWYMYVPVIGVLGMIPFLLLYLLTDNKALGIIGFNLTFLIGLFYSAPSFATIQGLARPDMRALASSIFLLLSNLLGVGLGPWFVGILSSALDTGSQGGGMLSLRHAQLIIMIGLIWSAFHYIMAARTLGEDMDMAVQN